MAKYICSVCGFVYDEAKGMPSPPRSVLQPCGTFTLTFPLTLDIFEQEGMM